VEGFDSLRASRASRLPDQVIGQVPIASKSRRNAQTSLNKVENTNSGLDLMFGSNHRHNLIIVE
jgi:hypothetical protein